MRPCFDSPTFEFTGMRPKSDGDRGRDGSLTGDVVRRPLKTSLLMAQSGGSYGKIRDHVFGSSVYIIYRINQQKRSLFRFSDPL